MSGLGLLAGIAARFARLPAKVKRGLLLAAVGLALAAALVAAGYGFGRASGVAQGAAELAAYKETAARELREANDRNRELERQHAEEVTAIKERLARENATERERDQRTVDDLRAGNRRLRLQVASCDSARSGEGAGTPGGSDGAARAELAPEAAAALWGIASDGDRAIRDLTALQDWAEVVIKACGVQTHEP